MDVVPFTLPNPDPFRGDSDGLVRFQEDILTIEFQTTGLLGRRSGVREVRIPVDGLDMVGLEKRFFSRRMILTIRTRSMKALEKVPGQSKGEVKLRVAGQYGQNAKTLLSRVRLRISEIRLDEELNGYDS